MADAKASRPGKQADDAEQRQPQSGEKLVKKGGREYIERQVQGKTVRTFVDEKPA